MDRRDFIKNSVIAAGGIALASCTGSNESGKSNDRERGTMSVRINPKTGESVSLLGYGCMRWPTVSMTGTEQDKNAEIDQEEVNRLVDRAIECGVTYFDTAPVYCKGKGEEATGIALSRHRRDKYTIATKMSNFNQDSWSFENSANIYRKSFEKLQVEYFDYYLLHSVGGGNGIATFNARFIDNGLLDFLLKEREEGRIRNLGFSFHGDVKVFDHLLGMHPEYHWDFVQIQMNYVDWNNAGRINPRNVDATYLYGELDRLGIPVVIMEPLLGGRLSNVPDRIAAMMLEREPSRSIASWAFRFCGSFPRVLTVLSGMTYMEHLEDNLNTFSPVQALEEEDFAFLDKVADCLAEYPTVPCNDCRYCLPCPYGIDIPGILLHYNKCVNEGSLVSDPSDSSYRKLRKRYLSSYARAIVPERQADKCIGCGQCIPKCPQNIDIPGKLSRIDAYVENLRRQG